jgi:acyl-coenzyme A synthetase/AMP-(fatty) acid ligase
MSDGSLFSLFATKAVLRGVERLARFKHPRRIAFVASLPRDAMGKVQKAELRSKSSDAL